MASPLCTVDNQAPDPRLEVAASATINIALEDSAGVNVWTLTCISADPEHYDDVDTFTAAIDLNVIAKTATFEMPADACAIMFESVVNQGLNVNGELDPALTVRFMVHVATAAGLLPVALNETTEADSELGWAHKFDAVVRTAGGGGSFTAAGDLSGSSSSQTVTGIQGQDVNAATPDNGDVLTFTGGEWAATPLGLASLISKTCTLEQFGAVGDGTTNDQAAFAAAITALNAGTYKTLILQNATYLVDGYELNGDDVSIIGQGPSSILKTAGSTYILLLRNSYQVTLSNFALLGTGTGGINQNGIEAGYLGSDGPRDLRIHNVSATGFDGRGFSWAYCPDIIGAILTNCIARNCTYGFYAAHQANLNGCQISDCTTGIFIDAGNVNWTGGDLIENTTAIRIGSGGNNAHGIFSSAQINHNVVALEVGAITNGHTFSGCHIYDGEINLTDSEGVRFDGCIIDASEYNFNGSQGTRFNNCMLPNGYANAIVNSNSPTTIWSGCSNTDGSGLPAFTDAVAATFTDGYGLSVLENQNLAVHGGQAAATYGGGVGVIYIGEADTNPASNPTNGVVAYVDTSDGYLKYRKEDGNVVVLDGSGSAEGSAGACTLEQFGAVGDGVTSDQAAWAAAITALGAGTYRTIRLGAKTYLVSAVQILPAGCSIIGHGSSSILKTAGDHVVIQVNSDDCYLAQFRIEGDNGTSAQMGIQLGVSSGATMPTDVIIDGVVVEDMHYGFRFVNGDGALFKGPTVSNCQALDCNYGFAVLETAEYVTFNNCEAWGSLVAPRSPGTGLYIAAGNCVWNGGNLCRNVYGVYLAAGANDAHGIVSGANINHNASPLYAGAIVYGHTFANCHMYGGECWLNGASGITFDNCTINFDVGSGLLCNSAVATRLNDCIFATNIGVSIDSTSEVTFTNPRLRDSNAVPANISAQMQLAFAFASDANDTLTKQESTAETIVVADGTISVARTITSNMTASAAKGRRLMLVNNNTYDVTFLWSTGTGILVEAGTKKILGSDGSNAIALMTGGGAGSFTAGGDLTGSSSSQNVVSLTGTAGVVTGPATAITIGATPSTAGTIRLPNTATIQARNAADSADLPLVELTAANKTILGNSTGSTDILAGNVLRLDVGGYGVQAYASSGALYLIGHASPGVIMTNSLSGDAVTYLTPYNGACSQIFANTVTSATVKFADNSTNSATGALITIQGQNATGTTATGGGVTITSGTGTTVAGNVVLSTGGTAKLTVAPTLTTSVSDFAIGSDTMPTAGLIRFNAPLATNTHIIRLKQGASEYDCFQINTGAGAMILGNTDHNMFSRGYACDISAGAGNYVTITSNSTEAARFTNAAMILGVPISSGRITNSGTGTLEDVAIAGATGFIHFTNATGPTVGGFVNTVDARWLVVQFTSNGTIAHESAGSTAANRVSTSDGSDITVLAGETVALIYNGGSSRWIPIGPKA